MGPSFSPSQSSISKSHFEPETQTDVDSVSEGREESGDRKKDEREEKDKEKNEKDKDGEKDEHKNTAEDGHEVRNEDEHETANEDRRVPVPPNILEKVQQRLGESGPDLPDRKTVMSSQISLPSLCQSEDRGLTETSVSLCVYLFRLVQCEYVCLFVSFLVFII